MSADVVIVGGGPAGASLALALVREQGVRASRIVIVDKAEFPRDKPCAGAVSAWGLEALAALGVPVTVPAVPMRGLRVLEGERVGSTTDADLGVVVRRSAFDEMLLRAAESDGVRVLTGARLSSIEPSAAGATVVAGKHTISARYVAACDGAGSTTRKLLGVREASRKGHLYVLDTGRGPADVGPADALCDFDLSVVAQGIEGYYWDFPTPLGGTFGVSRGIYHANLTPHRGVKEVLFDELRRRHLDPSKVVLRPFSTRPYVRGCPMYRGDVVFVGEAAGIDRATGEGIAQSIVMARIASRHLSRALRVGTARFATYAHDVATSMLGRHLLQAAWLARLVYRPGGAPFRELLLASAAARRAGARWYRGERLGAYEKAVLGMRLASVAGRIVSRRLWP